MKTELILPLIILAVAGCSGGPETAAPSQKKLVPLLSLEFSAPPTPEGARYLGLQEPRPFRLEEVQGTRTVLWVLDIYCGHCQRLAGSMSELQALIRRKGLGRTVKIIGIGRDNTQFEVRKFAEAKGLDFPVVPDKNKRLSEAISGGRFPYIVVVQEADRNLPARITYDRAVRWVYPEDFLGEAELQ